MESSKKSEVVDLAEERRRRGFDPVEEPTIDTASIDEAMARHPASGNRQPRELNLSDDERAQMREFIDTNRKAFHALLQKEIEQHNGEIEAKRLYEVVAQFKDEQYCQRGRIVLENILNDNTDTPSDELIFGPGQDS